MKISKPLSLDFYLSVAVCAWQLGMWDDFSKTSKGAWKPCKVTYRPHCLQLCGFILHSWEGQLVIGAGGNTLRFAYRSELVNTLELRAGEAGEVAQQLRALAVLRRTRAHIPASISGGSQLPITQVPPPSSGFSGNTHRYKNFKNHNVNIGVFYNFLKLVQLNWRFGYGNWSF